MQIRIRTTSTSSRIRLATWFTLALFALPCVAQAAPKHRKAKEQDPAITACVHERTGPAGGTPVREALEICTNIAKHNAKIAKARARAAKAIEACELEVSLACEDETMRDHDGGECSDETLRPIFNAQCLAQEGK